MIDHLAGLDQVEAVAGLALGDDPLADREADGLEAAGKLLQGGERERSEHRHPAHRRQLSFRQDRRRLGAADAGEADECEHRQDQASDDQGSLEAGPVHEHGRQKRAGGQAEPDQALEHPEDAPAHLVRDASGQEGVARDVDRRVGSADDPGHRRTPGPGWARGR